MNRALLLPLVASTLLFGGCFGSSYSSVVTGTDALIVEGGYSYDGRLVRRAAGELDVRLDDDEDPGLVTARVEDTNGNVWEIRFDQFHATSPTQDGGVQSNFYEHGDTGNGSTELPKFFAYVAAWGNATVMKNGQAIKEPNTLGDRFTAHLMVSKGKVRDPDTFQVQKADGSCCYSPADPTNGRPASDAGAQAILQLKTRSGAFFLHFQFEDVRVERS